MFAWVVDLVGLGCFNAAVGVCVFSYGECGGGHHLSDVCVTPKEK